MPGTPGIRVKFNLHRQTKKPATRAGEWSHFKVVTPDLPGTWKASANPPYRRNLQDIRKENPSNEFCVFHALDTVNDRKRNANPQEIFGGVAMVARIFGLARKLDCEFAQIR